MICFLQNQFPRTLCITAQYWKSFFFFNLPTVYFQKICFWSVMLIVSEGILLSCIVDKLTNTTLKGLSDILMELWQYVRQCQMLPDVFSTCKCIWMWILKCGYGTIYCWFYINIGKYNLGIFIYHWNLRTISCSFFTKTASTKWKAKFCDCNFVVNEYLFNKSFEGIMMCSAVKFRKIIVDTAR